MISGSSLYRSEYNKNNNHANNALKLPPMPSSSFILDTVSIYERYYLPHPLLLRDDEINSIQLIKFECDTNSSANSQTEPLINLKFNRTLFCGDIAYEYAIVITSWIFYRNTFEQYDAPTLTK